jgi:prepilin-type N-terminal cleavage/methylation domain-containing protein
MILKQGVLMMMKLNFKKKIKGFTLIELIIVMAIFGAIMAAAVGLMSPVSKVFNSTAQYEQTRAAIDNTQRYLSGTIKYADRFAMYLSYGDLSASTSCNVDLSQSEIEKNVANFAGKYFYCGDKSTSLVNKSDTPVYVMVFDNTNYRISKYSFYPSGSNSWLDCLDYNASSAEYSLKANCTSNFEQYAINESLFDDYSFQVYLGSYEYILNDSDNYTLIPQSGYGYGSDDNSYSEYSPTYSNLAFTIISYKNSKDSDNNVTRTPLYQSTSTAFSLVNVVNTNNLSGLDTNVTPKIESIQYYDSTNCQILDDIQVSTGNIYPTDLKSDSNKKLSINGDFYVIYTLPERVEDYKDDNQVDYSYVIATTTEATTAVTP